MSFTTGDGRKLTYRKLGHGPVLVCHPGGPGFSADYFGDLAALWEEQAGLFATDQELSDIVFREMPLYFAHFGTAEAGYLDTLKSEPINADTLKLFNKEIFQAFDMRPSLPAITCQTLVITGDDDFICGPICSEEICSAVQAT